jgi:hypothetical protein
MAICAFMEVKLPNQIDTQEIRDVKGFHPQNGGHLRRALMQGCPTAISISRRCLFTKRAKPEKNAVGEEDIRLTMELLQKVKPHQVFAAGDFADPNGTHIVCFQHHPRIFAPTERNRSLGERLLDVAVPRRLAGVPYPRD